MIWYVVGISIAFLAGMFIGGMFTLATLRYANPDLYDELITYVQEKSRAS